jgi:hypothetical protein
LVTWCIFPVCVCWTKKNLATLDSTKFISFPETLFYLAMLLSRTKINYFHFSKYKKTPSKAFRFQMRNISKKWRGKLSRLSMYVRTYLEFIKDESRLFNFTGN